MKINRKYITFYLLIISVVLTIPAAIFLPVDFQKYRAELQEITKSKESYYDYYDINGDGYSEEIAYYASFADKASVIVMDKGMYTLNQWNFPGKMIIPHEKKYGDYNHNGKKEVYIFSYRHDSIFFNCIEPYNDSITAKERFITKYRRINDRIDVFLYFCYLSDVNKDGYDELIFILTTGFAFQPRNLYSYDIKNDRLKQSPKSGVSVQFPFCRDVDDDQLPEIFIENCAYGNAPSASFPYSDHFCWLMVFTKDAGFLFPPVKAGIFPSVMKTLPVRFNNKFYIAGLYVYRGTKNSVSAVRLYDMKGRLVKEREMPDLIKRYNCPALITQSKSNPEKLFLIHGNGAIEQLDKNLKTVRQFRIEKGNWYISPHFSEGMDIDADGRKEYVFCNTASNDLLVCRNDFSHPVILELKDNDMPLYICNILKGSDQPEIFIQGKKHNYYFSYGKNPLYYFKYLVYAGIFGFIFLFITLIRKAYMLRRMKTERKIAELQFKAVSSQTDSHFTFNIINTLGALIYKNDAEKANYLLGKYSKLLRSSVIRADEVAVAMEEELESVENYLALEKMRMEDRFEYYLHIDNDVAPGMKIPKTLMMTFTENAMKHGIRANNGGVINIRVKRGSMAVEISIQNYSKKQAGKRESPPDSTGRGLKMLNQILELYYNLEKKRIAWEMKNFAPEEDVYGKTVNIRIPE